MIMPNNTAIRPVETWMSDGIAGDVKLHSATTGAFLGDMRVGENEHIPDYLAADPVYTPGYEFWKQRGGQEMQQRLGELTVCLYLTDPNDPEGLGHPDDLEFLLGRSDMVGYALGRGVNARLTDNRRIARVPGLVIPDPAYERKLNDALYELDAFDFDVTGKVPVISEMEKAVFEIADKQGDPTNPTLATLIADMVHLNPTQWAMAGAAGVEPGKQPARAKNLLLLASPENADLARKISILGNVTVETICATPEIEEDGLAAMYNQAIATGILPSQYIG
jgi:hypothetical protein